MKNSSFVSLFNQLDLQIIDCGFRVLDEKWHYDNISSPFHRIYWIQEGYGEISYYNNKIILQPKHAYLIPSGLVCNYHCPNYLSKFYIHGQIKRYGCHDFFYGLKSCLEIPFSKENITNLVNDSQADTPANILRCKTQILHTIIQFLNSPEMDSHVAKIPIIDCNVDMLVSLEKILNQIEQNPSTITVESLAKITQRNPDDLNKEFRKKMGITLNKYIRANLVEDIKIQLQITNKPIKIIANQYGFMDEFYFSRMFHNQVGISPREYRQKNKMN